MGKKRKRPAKDDGPERPSQKRVHAPSQEAAQHLHPVISLYYPRVVTLRQYLLDQLPASSKSRRRRIASLGRQGRPARQPADDEDQHHRVQQLADLLDSTLVGVLNESSPAVDLARQKDFAAFTASQFRSSSGTDAGPTCPLAEIVHFVLLTLFDRTGFSYQKPRHLLAHGFQRASASRAAGQDRGALGSDIPGLEQLYPNQNVSTLTQAPWTDVLGLLGRSGEEIMMRLLLDCGIFSCLDRRKGVYYQISGVPLCELEPVAQDRLEKPLSTAGPSAKAAPETAVQAPPKPQIGRSKDDVLRKPNSIIFVRRRMLYARPALNANGNVRFGLRHIHVLNRFPSPTLDQTVHVMKYIFPRQFGLHNVFTSKVDTRETVQPLKDYTVREDEIAHVEKLKRVRHYGCDGEQDEQRESVKIPKRLRGKAVELVQRLQRRNRRCPYTELLRYYCPVEEIGPPEFGPLPSQSQSSDPNNTQSTASEQLVTRLRLPNQSPAIQTPSAARSQTQLQPGSAEQASTSAPQGTASVPEQKPCLTDYATPASSVSAFCRAVLRRLIPNEFYGVGEGGISNRRIVMKHVDRFIRMRRFESLSLHEVCQGLKVTCIPWLESPKTQQHGSSDSRPKLSLSDLRKRTELLHELIYYIFDSLLIPLVRTNFYVTESQVHRNRLFYFRHDVWRKLTEQPLADLKSTVFEEIKKGTAQQILAQRSLGYGALRLLPKASGARPIVNLGRRVLKKSRGKKPFLAPSINSLVTPIFNALNYERARRPELLGSAILSVGDIHPRLKQFKENLLKQRHSAGMTDDGQTPRLFFVKLDIQSCFDTIPQRKVVQLIEDLLTEEAYDITKHVEFRPSDVHPDSTGRIPGSQPGKPVRKFFGRAAPVREPGSLPELVASGATRGRANAVFVDTGIRKEHSADELLDLLKEHVQRNLVRIGKKYFRQRNGIPQGSVLSSLLCNFFYAKMEREVLGFLDCNEAMLLRLIDDFLLITSKPDLAMRFLETMIAGQPEYGVSVNPHKSLVNFEATVNGIKIPRLVGTSLFPYCGVLVDTHTLELRKDRDRVLDATGDSAAAAIADSLTVETARAPGRAFRKKALTLFKIQAHPMFLDTAHNSPHAVLSSLYAAFVDSAMRMYRYLRCLRRRRHPSPEVIVRTIRDLIALAVRMIQSRRARPAGARGGRTASRVETAIGRRQIQYLAAAAFRSVLARKQTRFAGVLRWLEAVGRAARPETDGEAARLARVVREGNAVCASWRF